MTRTTIAAAAVIAMTCQPALADRVTDWIANLRQAQEAARSEPADVKRCFNKIVAAGLFDQASQPMLALQRCRAAAVRDT
jgi:hypothetical protein